MNDIDDIAEQYESCVDLLDHLLENVDIALDELDHPERSHLSSVKQQMNDGGTDRTGSSSSAASVIGSTAESLRPQSRWSDIDNSNAPFVPKLTSKPNAKVQLDHSLKRRDQSQEDYNAMLQEQSLTFRFAPGMGVGGPVQRDSSPHPYEHELRTLEFSRDMFQQRKEQIYKELNNTPCTWVDTVAALHELASTLECVSEIAIDLEHHSYRTFQGFTCLMQISTRDQDYLIDTLELRDSLQILNTSFTNPRILKVLHGADSDIIWMQRDLGLYIVNMFDTGKAAQALEKPKASLAYLLKFYCNVDSDKKYQLADWRVRPLPSEMVKYARQDTHYLLYIYDRLRSEILGGHSRGGVSGVDRMRHVLNQSRILCLRRYEKERFDEMSYLSVLNRFDPGFTREQTDSFRAIFKWRDVTARREDESVRYVMPNHMMIAVVEAMPTTVQKLISLCNPVPKLVRRDARILLKLIEQAAKGETINDNLINGVWPSDIQEHQQRLLHPSSVMSTPLNPNSRLKTTDAMLDTPSSVTISPITAMMDRMKYMESPVMTTEQLFGKAGWVEDAFPAASAKPMTFTFEEKELAVSPDQITNGGKTSIAQTINAKAFVPSAQGYSNTHLSRSDHSSIFSSMPSLTAHSLATPDASRRVSQINNSFTFESLLSPKKRSQPPPSQQQQQQQPHSLLQGQASTKDEFHAPAVSMEPPTTPIAQQQQQQQQTQHDQPTTPPDERVPKSLSDIYKISKKNKKKKITVKHASKVSNSSDMGKAGRDKLPKHSRKTKSFDAVSGRGDQVESLVDEQSFLRKIGWI